MAESNLMLKLTLKYFLLDPISYNPQHLQMIKRLQALFHPEQYQGFGKSRRYFEGWYYKVVNAAEDKAFAFIPGIAMDKKGKQHSFIQVLNGKKLTSEYFKFDFGKFQSETGNFKIKLADNTFSSNYIKLDLPSVKGQLNFSRQVPWPKKWYSPGIMGPFSFVPFMECYHGILSMDHNISGKLTFQDESIDFTGGRGYIEKDWGHSFPSGYIWMQTNHFSKQGISLKASVAKIPWLGNSFVGFIAGLWVHDRLFSFTTYNSTRLIKSFADLDKVELVLENSKYRLEILAHRDATTQLASPISGFMQGRIEESMTSKVEVVLSDLKNNKILLQDTGRNAGLEIAGNVEEVFV
ncbi:MAG: tocopherol cyclase family protein [Candidatus Tenebribacter mawsonii]|nr:tocopherol cyclase family protein [Candidatus Tenebribacter mawsonii]